MKRASSTIVALGFSVQAFSQATDAKQVSFLDDPNLAFYLTAGAVLFLFLFVSLIGIYVIRVVNILTEEAAIQNASQQRIRYSLPVSIWARLIQKLDASVPVEQEKKIELDHSYDGIRELDNHLPPWWKWLFYGTIAWSVVYLIVFHVLNTLPLSEDEYFNEVALAKEEIKKYQASQPQAVINENTLEYNNDPQTIEKGKLIYINNNCGGCHRPDGGGNSIGPNLADEYWLHGGELKNVFLTIKNGVVEKGMPAWGKAMSPQDVRDVTFFVISLQGTNPADPKAPQGEIFKVRSMPDSTRAQAGM